MPCATTTELVGLLTDSATLDVSVVIVSWNTREVLSGCLRSIYAQTRDLSFEVIVSDNDSRDGTPQMVRRDFPQVILLENGRNLGFAAANNLGIRRARGRYVLLLNPDTLILDGAIGKTVDYADAHPKAGIVGCQVLERVGKTQRTCFAFPSPLNEFLTFSQLAKLAPRSRFLGRSQLGWWDRDTELEVDVVSGMYLLARREAIREIGLLDEAYFVYGEEADWCYRFAKAGWSRVFMPGARIVHVDGGSKSTEQVSVKMYVQLQKSIAIFHRKNLGASAYWRLRCVYVGGLLVRLPLFIVLALTERSTRRKTQLAAEWAALKFHLLGIQPEGLP